MLYDHLFNKKLSWALVANGSGDLQVAEWVQQLGLESGVHWERRRVGGGLLIGRDCLVRICV